MNRTLLFFCSVIFLYLDTTAQAADIFAKSCSNSDVQTAINSAVNGDSVLIPGGTCTWTSQVGIPDTKGITLQGAGIGNTIIVDGGVSAAPNGLLLVTVASGNNVTRVTGFTINANQNHQSFAEITLFGRGLDRFRIDHVYFDNVVGTRAIFVMSNTDGADELSGLVDHVTCNVTNGASQAPTQCFNVTGQTRDSTGQAFTKPVVLGSNHATYFEDNSCIYQLAADDCHDSFDGHSVVVRYTTFIGISAGNHGADSSYRGAHLFEFYRNTFSSSGNVKYMANWRTGPNVMFDNAYKGNFSWPNVTLYRQDTSITTYGPPGAGPCNGISAWDGNKIHNGQPGQGYPCLDQTGWFFPGVGANGSKAVWMPAYFFKNTLSGVSIATQYGIPSTAPYILNNRDYYTDVGASCSGASCANGVGIGAMANRPVACTTGVGYWATDQGTWNQAAGTPGGQGVLYKCTATNTWTLYYTPYTYPHPLQAMQGAATPSPTPTNLRVQ